MPDTNTALRCEVLVVGAGPGGAAAGIALARRGVDVLVLDRAAFPRDKTCGDALSSEALRVLRQLGALPAIEARPHVSVRRRAAILPDGTRIDRLSADPGMIITRMDFDDALRRTAQSAGARVVEGVKVSSLERCTDGTIRALGPDLDCRARVVIGADGHGSVAHGLVGHPKASGRYLAVSATAYMRDVAPPVQDADEPVAEHYFTEALSSGYAWIFPAVDGISNVGVYQRADAYERCGVPLSQLLHDFIAERADRLVNASSVASTRQWPLPLSGRAIRPLAGDGVLLVGDAAGFIDPLSGEGIWQALYSGRLAGEIAAAAIEGEGLGRALQLRYQLVCSGRISIIGESRALIQAGMDLVVRHRLYRNAAVRGLLRASYGAASPT